MDGPMGMNLAQLLRNARLRLGLTQHQLAARAGVSLGAVRDLEQGRSARPRTGSVRALADVLGLSDEHRARLGGPAQPPAAEPPDAPGPASIAVLGPLALTRAAAPVPMGAGRHRVVLARLALTPGRAVRRDELIRLLWGEQAPPSAHNVLQTHVSRLRRLLQPGQDGPPVLTLSPAGYRLWADDDRLDLAAFRSRLEQAREPGLGPQRQFDLLADALDLWQGDDPAEDVPELHGDPSAVALVDERVDAAVRLARLGETVRREAEVLPRLRRLINRHQWHEGLHARLVVALAASGQQAAALDVYDEIRRRLGDELGVDPGDELAEARQAVLRLSRRAGDRPEPGTGPAGIPWQAPAPPSDFVGRSAQRRRLERLLRFPEPATGGAAPNTVCVVSGMAGVGKTSLALRVARSVRPDFPDGQLHLDLRGADQRPVATLEALARLLRGLGVESRAVPADVAEAAAMYRTVLADRRMLVILDNARGAAQVRPLLPGPGGSAVLVTSRNQCADLEGAALVAVPVLTRDEALGMLGRRDGSGARTGDGEAAVALVEACGRLPIALRVAAGRLVTRPHWSMRDLLDRLLGEQRGLAEFSVGDLAVTSAFELSYRELGPPAAAVFRAAALVPGADFSADAVAALLGAEPAPIQDAIDTLVTENLLQAARPGRYRYHDLLRLFATQTAAAELGETDRAAAIGRLLDWYLARTAAAMRLVYAEMVRLPVGAGLAADAGFPDLAAADAWLDDELGGLAAAIDEAATGPRRERSWQLADQLRGYFFLHRDTVTWLRTGRAGLAAAEAAADRRAQAAMHQTLGQAHWSLGRHHRALESYHAGVAAARSCGWVLGEAYLLHNSGLVQAELGRLDEARESYGQALRLADGPEFAHVRAATLNDLGTMCAEQGRLTDAVGHFEEALAINQGAARRRSAMSQRLNLGMALRQLEDFETARAYLDTALSYFREGRVADGEMCALDELSQLYAQLGEWSAAVDAGTEAVRLAEESDNARFTAALANTLGFALLGARAVTDARIRFEQARRLSRQHGFRYFEAQSAVGIAAALLHDGDTPGAGSAAADALATTRAQGYRTLTGDALLMLARVAVVREEPAAAAEHCRGALEQYASTGLPGKVREATALAADVAARAGGGRR
ncbi:BTAD domain-containing putative transcriptional regulator [Actinoplanes nipponensis]|nr:BTAD domain-containing putative transcriptional regulator [Actinoplanes nipponensis]